ncbi:helix-turn-helix transcriptional regulator [Paenibacillus wynnii]|uniref:helix-turn-helix transcriptional regulator n=1 Tax=Paenibacillus wynnii TaxID=268407 RepID=UPI002792C02A|nr:YafY family protein [Paenibacillus wynnii]MDQ0194884.1 putative DNA-binding transcriptional regulator YafY [Paenibacillus wynnii]
MKIERLLGIVIFLLNREKVSARTLAKKFEVSHRTIQRDIETINISGIPIVSSYGKDGGYSIMNSFKMERQLANESDYAHILTALKGLSTAYGNPKIEKTIEKIVSVSSSQSLTNNISLDFGVLREGEDTDNRIQLIENAISRKKIISFEYTNAENWTSQLEVDPILLTYKWYAWYLFAYCTNKQDYRLYKLVRMNNIQVIDKHISKEHERADLLMARYEAIDTRTYITCIIRCKAEVKMFAMEYLNGSIEKDYANGDFILKLYVPENEHLWFGTILSLGNKVVVLEPEELKQRILKKAREIIKLY